MNTAVLGKVNEKSAAGLFASAEKRKLILSLLLVALTFVAYAPLQELQFINYDDPSYVTSNFRVQAGLNQKNIAWAFTTLSFSNWHPITWLSHMADCQLFGLNPAGHHFTNLSLHAANVVILFLLLLQATGALWRSLLVAALFAVHPLNVESVAWVSERKNVLSTLFLLLTIWAYGWYALKPNWRRYAAVAILFALGLMTKPMLVTLPFILLLLDYWPLTRLRRENRMNGPPGSTPVGLIIEKAPLLLLSFASSIITVIAQKNFGALGNTLAFPSKIRIMNAVVSYGQYLVKTVLPVKLAVFYPYPVKGFHWWQLVLPGLLLSGITIWVSKQVNKPYLLVGWLWYLGTLVPVIGIVQVGLQAMADRYAYVPLIGIFVLVVWGFADGARKNAFSGHTLCLITICVLGALAADTRYQLRFWRDSLSLFSHAVDVTENNPVAQGNLGIELSRIGQLDLAGSHFHAALASEPRDARAHHNMGSYLFEKGKIDEAIKEYGLALYWANDAQLASKSRYKLGQAFYKLGKIDQAKANFAAAVRLDPENYEAQTDLGLIAYKEGMLDEALSSLSRSIEIFPTDQAFLVSGLILQQQERTQEAIAAYRKALQISPNIPLALQNLDLLVKAQARRNGK